jgi:uridine kinase
MKKTFQEFIRELLVRFGENERIVIVIDGFGGSGKSTFATKLCEHLPNAGIVCVDHFYQPLTPGGENEFHWDRFEKEVIEQLRKREAICYALYSWKEQAFFNDISLQKDQPVIVEGVYTSQEKYRDAYSIKIWIDTPEHIRLERGVKRDGESVRVMWENVWLPYTRTYMAEHRPDEAADIVIDGAESDFTTTDIIIKKIKGV